MIKIEKLTLKSVENFIDQECCSDIIQDFNKIIKFSNTSVYFKSDKEKYENFILERLLYENNIRFFVTYNNREHNPYGPSCFIFSKKFQVFNYASYKLNGMFNRENNQPTLISVDNINSVIKYHINDDYCRYDGPAEIYNSKYDYLEKEYYYLNGEFINKKYYWKTINYIKNKNNLNFGNAKIKKLKLYLDIAKYYNREDLVKVLEEKILTKEIISKMEK